VAGLITASIASRLSSSVLHPPDPGVVFLQKIFLVQKCLILVSTHFRDAKFLHNSVSEHRHHVAVSHKAVCLKGLPGSVQGLLGQPSYLTQCVALDAGAESKACYEEPSGDCRSRSGERCEEHRLPGSFCGHLLCSHIPAPQALLLGPQAALLCCRLCPLPPCCETPSCVETCITFQGPAFSAA